jgi:hypothetical protein
MQAALTVVGSRNTTHDGPNILVDFSHAQLANADLDFLHLSGADRPRRAPARMAPMRETRLD